MKKNLIILSGWAVPPFVWQPLIDELGKNYQIHILTWNDVNSLEDFKQKAIDIFNQMQEEMVPVIGWSLGSLVALEMAASHCNRVQKLILFSSTAKFLQDPDGDYTGGWHKRILHRMNTMIKKDSEKTLNQFYKQLFSDVEIKNGHFDKFLNKLQDANNPPSVEALSLGLDYLTRTDVRDKIRELDIPTLLIHGEQDIICPREAGTYLHEHLMQSHFVELKDTGHIPFFTHTEKCYESLISFLSTEGEENDR